MENSRSALVVDRAYLREVRNEEKFPHRLFPGKPITSIEELQQHEWVYSLSRHRAIHREALLSEQTRSVMSALQRNNIREALEMTDQEVVNEKIISNRAAYLARIEYRERLFDHACAIHDSVADVRENQTDTDAWDPAG